MSPSPRATVEPDSRLAGLYEARRWLVLLLLTEAWLFAAIVGVAQWSALSLADRVILVVALAALVAGWLLSRRDIGLWLVSGAPLLLVVAAALNDGTPSPAKWIALSVSAGHVAYALVMLTPPAVGLASIGLLGAGLMVIWSHSPTNVFPGPLVIAGGWVSFATLLLSGLALWWVWNRLVRDSRQSDRAMLQLNERRREQISAQEQSRMWRAAAASVHESLLSTLRYIIQTDQLDRAGLAATAAQSHAPGLSTADPDLGRSVRQATAARIATDIVRLDPSVIDIPISSEARVAARSAIVECALNAVLHGEAKEVVVSARRSVDRWLITIADDGTGLRDGATPGLGWTLVLDEGLAEVGGTWTIDRTESHTVVTISLPSDPKSTATAISDDGFDQGRILISAPLAAVGVAGIAYDVLAGWGTALGALPIVAATSSSLAAALIVAVRRRWSAAFATGVIILLAAVPWLMIPLAGDSSTRGAAMIAGLTTAGYSLLAVAVWSRPWHWVVGLSLWAVGAVAFAVTAGPGALSSILVSLVNCLVIVPIVLIVAAIGSRRFQRTQAALLLDREAMRRETIRGNAATLIDRHLSACVAQAQAIVADLAEGADLDDGNRARIECLEGLIRSTIQVDPITSGEFARASARLVNSAFNGNVPARVGTLVASSDLTPLPPDLLTSLDALALRCDRLSVRAFQVAERDYLSLELSSPTQQALAGVEPLRRLISADMTIEIEHDLPSSLIVIVSRQITA